MAWGSELTATQLTSITTEQFFDAIPQLAVGEKCRVQIEVDFPTTPTEFAQISVYTTVGATPAWDIVPVFSIQVNYDNDPSLLSFTIPWDVYKFRIGVQRVGSTDTLTSADMTYRVGTP